MKSDKPTAQNKSRPTGKKQKPKKKKVLSPIDRFKIETAKELGLWEKVKQVGWAGLSAAETGQVGGYMTRKMRSRKMRNLGEYAAARAKRGRKAQPLQAEEASPKPDQSVIE